MTDASLGKWLNLFAYTFSAGVGLELPYTQLHSRNLLWMGPCQSKNVKQKNDWSLMMFIFLELLQHNDK